MIKLFSYCKLWQDNRQKSVFGTTFNVEKDLDYISNWDVIRVKLYGKYKRVAIEGPKTSVLAGAIINVPDEYIDKFDKYKGKEYKRVSIKTLTGNDCQIYVKR